MIWGLDEFLLMEIANPGCVFGQLDLVCLNCNCSLRPSLMMVMSWVISVRTAVNCNRYPEHLTGVGIFDILWRDNGNQNQCSWK